MRQCKNMIPGKKVKIIAVLLFSIGIIAGCNNQSEAPKEASVNTIINKDNKMDNNELQNLGKRYALAWSSQNARSLADFYAPDGSLTVNAGEPAVGHETIAKTAQGFMTAFPDMLVTLDSLPVTEKGVAFHWTLTGTNSGPGGTGNKVNISGVEIWQLNNNGLIITSKGSYDSAEYNRQLKEGIHP